MPFRKHFGEIALALLVALAATGPAAAQCILANPSFEVAGSGGQIFGGWNQYGAFGSVTDAYHGSKAARVSGPDSGAWDISSYWQTHDCAPGEHMEVTGHVLNPSSNPLTGQCSAIVNVEWRDSGGALIDYQTVVVADASSPTDVYMDFAFVSDPAPSGTSYTHLLLAVLQSPTDPSPDVYYDQVTYYSTSAPTIDDKQWGDFWSGTTLSFGGRTWRIKGPGWYGPGYNYFRNANDTVWVDGSGQLHLKLWKIGSTWVCPEVVTEETLGYGDYILTTVGRLDQIDPQTVLGIFLWEYGPCYDSGYLWWNAFNEIDIEYSRWGNPSREIAQFVAQPYNWSGNTNRFDATFSEDEVVSHAMRWLADKIEYRVWRGGPDDESPVNMIHSWTYTGPHIPRPEQPRMHLNFWKISDTEPAGDQEIIFQDFVFVPAGGASPVDDEVVHVSSPAGWLYPAMPNPFNPRTTVRFELTRDEFIQLDVYDLNGRRIRSLVSEHRAAGEHRETWNGLDDDGRAQASGVYLFQLKGRDFLETRRAVLVR